MLVLLWGLSTERPLAAVREELVRRGVPVLMVDQHRVLDTGVRLYVGEDLEGEIRVRDRWVDLGTVSAVYLRPYDSWRVPAVAREGPESAAWRHALAVDYVMASWSEMTHALVVNRLQAMAANGSKPYQLEQIRSLGFDVPETLVTTDPGAARDFWERHGDVIYKSVSGTRSIVSRLRPEHAERLADVSFCPTQFQRYIPGTDHRVHIVGDEVFACEALSEADDYRYPGRHQVEVRACHLPQTVEDRCRLASAALELPVAGIDLRRTPEGDWYCFEVNPSPAFTYYESRTGQPIGNAIARLLAAGPRSAPEFVEIDGVTRKNDHREILTRRRSASRLARVARARGEISKNHRLTRGWDEDVERPRHAFIPLLAHKNFPRNPPNPTYNLSIEGITVEFLQAGPDHATGIQLNACVDFHVENVRIIGNGAGAEQGGLRLPGGGYGCLLQESGGLVDEEPPPRRAGLGGAGDGPLEA